MSALTEFAVSVISLTSTPTPMPAYTGDPNLITPGVVGFIAIFVIAVATVFLLIDMNRRVRRTKYRELVRQQIEEEQKAASDPTE